MMISSIKGGETGDGIAAAGHDRRGAEFSNILGKQIAGSVKAAQPAVSIQGTGNKTSIAPEYFFRDTICTYHSPVSNLLTRYSAYEKECRDIPCSNLNRDTPELKTQQASGTVATHKNRSVPNNGRHAGSEASQGPELLLLGTLGKSDPTVSDLMIKHPTHGKDCWNILYSRINRDKPYTTIPSGSHIYLNPETLEVVWNRRAVSGNDAQATDNTPKDTEPVLLGTISKSNPTVSDLMIRHPAYGKDCWDILHSGINRDKAFTTIQNGSRIYVNPQTLEVVWGGNGVPAAEAARMDQPKIQAKSIPTDKPDPFSAGLVKAVKPYFGKPYGEMNCFELVVQGLEGVGIRYYGRGGLGERLVKMATEKGLSSNSYLSGEGLIETSGSQIYSKSVPKIRNSKTEAGEVYQEVEPLLHKGLILSFSTPTRGHMGIVSRREHNWTYINSGRMDNRLEGRASRGVGEEFLSAEIQNWFRLAANRKEPLQITVGRLDEDKLRALLT